MPKQKPGAANTNAEPALKYVPLRTVLHPRGRNVWADAQGRKYVLRDLWSDGEGSTFVRLAPVSE